MTSGIGNFSERNLSLVGRGFEEKDPKQALGSTETRKGADGEGQRQKELRRRASCAFKIKREKGKQREVEKARAKERYGRHAWSRRRPVRKQTDCFAGSFVMRPWHINYFSTASPWPPPHTPRQSAHIVRVSSFYIFPPSCQTIAGSEITWINGSISSATVALP